MPVRFSVRRAVRRCSRPYSWSTYRSGCRFAPGHDGPCKPKKAGR